MSSQGVDPPLSPPPSGSPSATPADLFIGSVTRLAEQFGYSMAELGEFESVLPEQLPDAYRVLLAHTGHMTVTLEAFHSSLVDVHVLQERSDESSYAREIVLTRHSDGAVVQYGLVRIWLADLPADVRDEIRAQQSPLGRVLIRHGLLREVELISFWQVTPGSAIAKQLGDETVFGRSAQILLNERPTIQLLEIVRAEESSA